MRSSSHQDDLGRSVIGQNFFVMRSVHEPLLLVPFNCHKKRTPYQRTPYDLAGLKTLYLLRKTYNLSVASETLWLYSLSLSHVCFFYKAVESSIFNPSRWSQFQRPKKFRDQLVFIISLKTNLIWGTWTVDARADSHLAQYS